MLDMVEAHFCSLTSQSSIYGLTSLLTKTGSHKILMASSKRKVYCVEYSKSNNGLLPSSREVHFTYIPGGAEIISIDAFSQACREHDFVIGITFVKCDSSGRRSQYFNIYSDWEPSSECDLDNIAQGCLSLELNFIPFQLTHTKLIEMEIDEVVWLLSGSDCKVHLYREDMSHQSFDEEPSSEHFPEFENLQSVVLWMDFMLLKGSRITAAGCRDGRIFVSLVNFSSGAKIISSWSIEHDGPIASVQLFCDSSCPWFIFDETEWEKTEQHKEKDFPVHLVVANTLEVSVVYRDILKKGLNLGSQYLLPKSNGYDCATCICIADIDMDGCYEILLGTYGQQLLAYKWQSKGQDSKGNYILLCQQEFPNPLLALAYIDITGDGLKELLVLSTKGLHITQHNLKKTEELCIGRLKMLLQRQLKMSE